MKSKIYYLCFRAIYYLMLFVLIMAIIYPHTCYYFKVPFFVPFSYRLNHSDLILEVGEHDRVYVVGRRNSVAFSTTDFKVADVDFHGTIEANRVGTAVIKVKVKNKVLKCRVRVIKLNRNVVSLTLGDKKKLKVKGKVTFVNWKSSNKSIATVNRFGKVTAKGRGMTKVTAKIRNKTLTCKIIVK